MKSQIEILSLIVIYKYLLEAENLFRLMKTLQIIVINIIVESKKESANLINKYPNLINVPFIEMNFSYITTLKVFNV